MPFVTTERFRKRAVACTEKVWRVKERVEYRCGAEMLAERWQEDRKSKRERERMRKRSREVVGGSDPYKDAGTTLASAILSAEDIHNHLVPLSRGTRVVVSRCSLLNFVLRREVWFSFWARGKKKKKNEERERQQKDFLMSSFRASSTF